MTSQETAWDQCLRKLEGEISDKELNTWLRPLRMLQDEANVTLLAPNRVVMERIRSEYSIPINRALSSCLGYDVTLQVLVGTGPVAQGPARLSADGSEATPATYVKATLNPAYTLATFIEGKSNSQAKAAGLLVAGNPGVVYNPLLIYGESGLGKTHLMHGIGSAIMGRSANARVVYVGAEVWWNQMVSAIRYGRMVEFKNYYRSADALLIDDIHFLAGKERSQDEFFHTFNALIDGNKQIVLTCDRYPRELDQLDERLKSRFTWGLSVPVEPPDLETRVAILLAKAENASVRLPKDVAMLVAQRIRTNVRELEGALHRLNASAQLTGADINPEFARACLRDMLASYDRSVTLDSIKRVVAGYYKIRINELNSARRTRSLARPRQVAMALAKELTQHSYPEIGEAFGKDHTTVLHACRKIQELRDTEERVKEDYENLHRLLTS